MTRDLPFLVGDVGARRPRLLLAALLRAASSALDRVASSLALEPPLAEGEPVLEFHAEAGAPEGALYVDGAFVGVVAGVTRL